jgi:hypothetical protein
MLNYLKKLNKKNFKATIATLCALPYLVSPAYSDSKSVFDPNIDPKQLTELGITVQNVPPPEKGKFRGTYSDFTQEVDILTFWGDKSGVEVKGSRKLERDFNLPFKVKADVKVSATKTSLDSDIASLSNTYDVKEVSLGLHGLIHKENVGKSFQKIPFVDHEPKINIKIIDTHIENDKLNMTQDTTNLLFIPGYKGSIFLNTAELKTFITQKIPAGTQGYDYLDAKGNARKENFPRVGFGVEKVISLSGDNLSKDSIYLDKTLADRVNEPWIFTGDLEVAKKFLFTAKFSDGGYKDNKYASFDYFRNNLLVPKVKGNRNFNTAERLRVFYDDDYGMRNIFGLNHSVQFLRPEISQFATYQDPGLRYNLKVDTQIDNKGGYAILARIPFPQKMISDLSFWKSQEEKDNKYFNDVIEAIVGFRSDTHNSADNVSYGILGLGWNIKKQEKVNQYLKWNQ